MTRDEIIRMAREAGITFDPRWGMCTTGNVQIERLVHAAYEAGAAAEREACIDINAMHGGRVEVEAAIRARGEK